MRIEEKAERLNNVFHRLFMLTGIVLYYTDWARLPFCVRRPLDMLRMLRGVIR